MLKQRLLTASVAAVAAIAGVLALPANVLLALIILLTVFGAREWGRLAGLQGRGPLAVYMVAIAAAGLWASGLLPATALATAGWLYAAFAFWLVFLPCLLFAAGNIPVEPLSQPSMLRPSSWLALGLVVLPGFVAAFAALLTTETVGRGVLLFAMAVVWVADSGAYFAGRSWGRCRLAPRLSAGKTWEGVLGGLAAVALYGWVGGWLLGLPVGLLAAWILLTVIAASFSVVGDLLESVLKRQAGVKDSGAALPGHGGILDRGDSLLAALPVFTVGLTWLPGWGS